MGGRVGRIDRRHLAVLEGFGPVVTGLQRLQRLGRDRVAENEVFDADLAIVTSRSDEGVFARLDFGDVRFVVVREMLGIALDGDSPNEGSLDSSLPTPRCPYLGRTALRVRQTGRRTRFTPRRGPLALFRSRERCSCPTRAQDSMVSNASLERRSPRCSDVLEFSVRSAIGPKSKQNIYKYSFSTEIQVSQWLETKHRCGVMATVAVTYRHRRRPGRSAAGGGVDGVARTTTPEPEVQ